jgi:hypothetical protein
MWARIITLQRTIHTPTPTMQGGEPTPIFHGVTTRMCKIPKGSKEISYETLEYSEILDIVRTCCHVVRTACRDFPNSVNF